ncbi:MAG: ABC transporter ATP-binding protein [Elusimicrobiota bacterium]
MDKILSIKGLRVEYGSALRYVEALRGVDVVLGKGECIGIVGESGCGKTTLAAAILGLIDPSEGRTVSETISFKPSDNKGEVELSGRSPVWMREIRGKKISLVLQDPYNSLNPVIRIGKQLKEAYFAHNRRDREAVEKVIRKKLEEVRLPSDGSISKSYPHQLSGGMLQRVCIAMALLNEPEVLIADEPTSNLDVTIQKEIMHLLKRLKHEFNLSMIFITHNLNLVSEFADRIYILYAGEVVEYGPAEYIFKNPVHFYTKGLISALPSISDIKRDIRPIPGKVPSPGKIPPGCGFLPRCSHKTDICSGKPIGMKKAGPDHFARCTHI